jgi:hypothetical protein
VPLGQGGSGPEACLDEAIRVSGALVAGCFVHRGRSGRQGWVLGIIPECELAFPDLPLHPRLDQFDLLQTLSGPSFCVLCTLGVGAVPEVRLVLALNLSGE